MPVFRLFAGSFAKVGERCSSLWRTSFKKSALAVFMWDTFVKKMPLHEFQDYDDYWNKRPCTPIHYRYKYVVSQLPDTGRVLDIGCGDGTFLSYVRSKKPKLDLMGIDISSTAIAKLRAKGIPGLILDLRDSRLPQETRADYVVLMELLEHIPNPEAVMIEARKLEAKRYFVTIPNLGYVQNRLRLALGGKMPITVIQFHIREHLRFWTVADFRYWAECLGYRVIACVGQNGPWSLWKIWPSVFARQIMYVLEPRESQ